MIVRSSKSIISTDRTWNRYKSRLEKVLLISEFDLILRDDMDFGEVRVETDDVSMHMRFA